MKKILSIIMAALLIAALPLSAGGSKEQETEGNTLTMTWWGGQQRHEQTQQLFDEYSKENPGLTIKGTPSNWDGYFEKLATQAASGSMPDIVQMDYLYIKTYAKDETHGIYRSNHSGADSLCMRQPHGHIDGVVHMSDIHPALRVWIRHNGHTRRRCPAYRDLVAVAGLGSGTPQTDHRRYKRRGRSRHATHPETRTAYRLHVVDARSDARRHRLQ